MAIGVTGTVEMNGETQQQIYEDAVFAMEASAIAVQMGNVLDFNDRQDDSERRGGRYPKVNAETVGEYDDYSSPQKFDITNFASLTPVEKIAMVALTDKRRRREGEQVYSNVASELGQAMARSVDDALISGIATFTGGTLGNGTGAINWKYLAAARSRLRKAGYEGPIEALLCEYHAYDLGILTVPGTTVTNQNEKLQDEVLDTGFLGRFMGIDIYVSGRVPITSEGEASANAKSGVFAKGALALDRRVDPILEPERKQGGRRWNLFMHQEFAAGGWDKAGGIILHALAKTPDPTA
jgi:hypothetical protein